MNEIVVEQIKVKIFFKNIKNLYLRFFSNSATVEVSAPVGMPLGRIRDFILSKLNWIKKQQNKVNKRQTKRSLNFLNNEKHYFFGQLYVLKIIEIKGKAHVLLRGNELRVYVKKNMLKEKKEKLVALWYRVQLIEVINSLIRKWELPLNVKVNEFRIKRMKTRWGSCNYKAKRLWLNLELVKHPIVCLEYVVVHEMLHLIECSHNQRFKKLMFLYLPNWQKYKRYLNEVGIFS